MKKKTEGWFPKTRPKQKTMFTNVKAKIENYQDILPLSGAKVTRILLICNTFLAVIDYVEQTRATVESLTDWQDLIFKAVGGTKGAPAPAAPAFLTPTLPVGAFVGIFEEFQELVADIKSADNYTRTIGEDLMIVSAEGVERDAETIVPELKLLASGYEIKISGSMQGMSAVKIEYRKKGSEIPQSFFLTNLPGTITITPTQAGEPESGSIRAIFIEKNKETGQWSPNYTLTVG